MQLCRQTGVIKCYSGIGNSAKLKFEATEVLYCEPAEVEEELTPADFKSAFKLQTEDKQYLLFVKSEKDRDAWVTELKRF
jgi:hypothetical protein